MTMEFSRVYAHLVSPYKIPLSRTVSLVPQIGHDHGLVSLSFGPERDVLMALDAGGSVHVWSTDPSEVLAIAPLPAGDWTAACFVDEGRIAALDTAGDSPVWWAREAARRGRWEPVGTLEDLDSDLAGRPRLEQSGEHVEMVADGTRRDIASGGELRSWVVDPLRRFVAFSTTEIRNAIRVVEFDTGEEVAVLSVDAADLVELALNAGGDLLLALDSAGVVHRADPLRDTSMRPMVRVDKATCFDLSSDGVHVAVGDAGGQISLYEVAAGQRVLRTPKQMRGFERELLLVEDVGFVGIRDESYTAFIDEGRSIQPIRPLPGRMTSAASARSYPIFLVALDDKRVLEIDVGDESVNEIESAPFPLHGLAASELGFVGVGAGGLYWFDGDSGVETDYDDAASARALSVDPSGSLVAVVHADRVVCIDSKGTQRSDHQLAGVVAAVLTRYKSRHVVMAVDEDAKLWRLEVAKGTRHEVGAVSFLDNPLSRIVALSVDEDQTLRGLAYGENGHRLLLMIEPETGEADLATGLVVVGHQVVAVYDDEGTWLRQDEQRSVRLVQDLIAYEVHEWSRQAEPGVR